MRKKRTVTNKLGLPEPYVRAVENDPYDSGDSDYTATSLLMPARLKRILETDPQGCVQDASELADALLGQAVHVVLERAALDMHEPDRFLVEERLYSEFTVDGKVYKVSAQVDLLDRKKRELHDYKTTSAYAIQYGPKQEHQMQLALQEELLRRAGEVLPERRSITAVLKDWKPQKAAASESYPQAPSVVVDHEAVSSEATVAWVESRVRAHEAAKQVLPLCSEEETWARPEDDTFAAVKPGASRATKVFATRAEAEAFVSAKPHLGLVVEDRLGPAVRCRDWCPARRVCRQWLESPRNLQNQQKQTKQAGDAPQSSDDDMVEV